MFPARQLDRQHHALTRLSGIGLDWGEGDVHRHVPAGARAFADELERLQIEHTAVAHDGDHDNRVRERLTQHAIPFLTKTLGW